jgi:tripartite-type tricarboxylate transporter receptor subunit TctC
VRQAFAVGPQVPASVKTLKDFFDWAKAHPQLANCGSPGPNSPQGILLNILSKQINVPLNHVPYKGSAPGIVDLLGGQIAGMLSPVGDYLPHLKEGRLRLLGMASAKRSIFAPDTQTFQELGFPDMTIDDTCGIVMAKNTPAEIQNRVATAIAAVIATPETAQAFAQMGLEPISSTPAEYTRTVNQNAARWIERIKASGVKLNG